MKALNIAELQNNKLTGANICFTLKQASFALIFSVAPGTAVNALHLSPGGGDDFESANYIFENCNLTHVVSEPAQVFGNGVGIDESGSPETCMTGNGSDDTRSADIKMQDPETSESTLEAPAYIEYLAEPVNTGWVLVMDNDALVSSSRDEDYTGGVSVGLGGNRVTKYRFSLNPALTWVNKKLHLDGGRQPATLDHMMRFGLALFTPDLGSTGGPRVGDRPFANLLFLENAQIRVDANRNRAYQTTLTLGILGTDIGEAVQDAIHHSVTTTK